MRRVKTRHPRCHDWLLARLARQDPLQSAAEARAAQLFGPSGKCNTILQQAVEDVAMGGRKIAPRQMSHFWPLGLVGGGCEQDFSTTRHQGGTLGSSWMQPPAEDSTVPLVVV